MPPTAGLLVVAAALAGPASTPAAWRDRDASAGPNAGVGSLRGLERKLALASIAMDLSEPDNAPGDLLNRVIWHSVKGSSTPYPSLARAACLPVLKRAGTAIE